MINNKLSKNWGKSSSCEIFLEKWNVVGKWKVTEFKISQLDGWVKSNLTTNKHNFNIFKQKSQRQNVILSTSILFFEKFNYSMDPPNNEHLIKNSKVWTFYFFVHNSFPYGYNWIHFLKIYVSTLCTKIFFCQLLIV